MRRAELPAGLSRELACNCGHALIDHRQAEEEMAQSEFVGVHYRDCDHCPCRSFSLHVPGAES